MFVVIEGIEGSGKSTLVTALAEHLKAGGHAVAVTREPGGTPVGDAIREIFLRESISITALTESYLVNAARAQHVADVVRPMLEQGRIVLCDRFTDSTLAYQGYGRGLDVGELRTLCATAADGIEPDLVLLLDLPVSVARARLRERAAEDRIESEDDAFHERVRRGFLELAEESLRHVILDATTPPQAVLKAALDGLSARLGLRVP
ncbi:MAG: dTMP kinase [Candidatus Eremiobacteraeota bacterium]|nr:dTMP kinase [Candidatus Eremiobacteraeota bacterium]